MVKLRLKKGDMVTILRGKDRGKKGKIMAVSPSRGVILVEGAQMVKKHVKSKKAGQKAQLVSVASPIPVAKVQLVCPSCGKSTRVGKSKEGRTCKKCQASL